MTEHIGLIATASTTYNEPYNLARRFASLDHISRGRAGWNIVTTAGLDAARNFNLDSLPPHKERYERAAEFIEVSKKLWDSWDDNAALGDKEHGVWGDDRKIYPPRMSASSTRWLARSTCPGLHRDTRCWCRPAPRTTAGTSPPATPRPSSPPTRPCRRPGVLRRPQTACPALRSGPRTRQDPAGHRADHRGHRSRGARAGGGTGPAHPARIRAAHNSPNILQVDVARLHLDRTSPPTCPPRRRSRVRRAAVHSWSTWPGGNGSPCANCRPARRRARPLHRRRHARAGRRHDPAVVRAAGPPTASTSCRRFCPAAWRLRRPGRADPAGPRPVPHRVRRREHCATTTAYQGQPIATARELKARRLRRP